MAAEHIRFVGYFRISGKMQGLLRAELEEQRAALRDFALVNGGTVIAECVDYENGNRAAFVQLDKALSLTRGRDATLVLAKLGLMIRDWRFLLQLQLSGVEVVALDAPVVSRATLRDLALEARRNDRRLPPEESGGPDSPEPARRVRHLA